MSIDYARHNAEQAVRVLAPTKHRDWYRVERDGLAPATHLGRALELLDDYKTALIAAHAQLLEQTETYQKRVQFNADIVRERTEADWEDTLAYRARLDRDHGNALRALQSVVQADRAGRKTVRVSDILAILNETKENQA